ncbi:DUF7261 family protein [Halomicrococcus sp. SG-WS-1]|uniref:DUF7261 family protein n=1 Tax=Halomicrococcus sp. SG-WS-1 TaxID=3439057 RepID=UPI003F791FE9
MTSRDDLDRAQLVLAAAAVVAVALAPVVFAYLQLGYHADVRATGDYDAPVESAERVLDRAVHDAADGVPSSYRWESRSAAVSAVRSRVADDVATLETSRVEEGTVYRVGYNRSAARAWANRRCPSGPDRQFGACEADRGVVVQNRGDETHVLAVTFDVHVTTDRGEYDATVAITS